MDAKVPPLGSGIADTCFGAALQHLQDAAPCVAFDKRTVHKPGVQRSARAALRADELFRIHRRKLSQTRKVESGKRESQRWPAQPARAQSPASRAAFRPLRSRSFSMRA